MTVELDKKDLISLVKGIWPSYQIMDDKELKIPLKSKDRKRQEKNVISLNFME